MSVGAWPVAGAAFCVRDWPPPEVGVSSAAVEVATQRCCAASLKLYYIARITKLCAVTVRRVRTGRKGRPVLLSQPRAGRAGEGGGSVSEALGRLPVQTRGSWESPDIRLISAVLRVHMHAGVCAHAHRARACTHGHDACVYMCSCKESMCRLGVCVHALTETQRVHVCLCVHTLTARARTCMRACMCACVHALTERDREHVTDKPEGGRGSLPTPCQL